MNILIWFVSLYSIVNLCDSQLTREYDNCVIVNYDHGVRFYWTLDLEGERIAMGFHGNLGGYLGIALSANGKILGGDYPFNYTDSWVIDVNFRYVDLWFSTNVFTVTSQPSTDKQQDLKNASLSFNGTSLFGEFYRAIDTKDPFDYVIPIDQPIFLLWAGHNTKPWTESGGYANHVDQDATYDGAISFNFALNSSCEVTLTPGLWESLVGDFIVKWDLTADGKFINFTMTGVTLGWIGIGISTGPKMSPSDVYVGWIIDGQVTLYDSYSGDYNQPVIDAHQDVSYVSGFQEGGSTTIFFQRALVTGDSQDVDITTETPLFLLYALADVPGSGTTYPMHTSIGVTPVSFFGGPIHPPPPPIGQTLPVNGTFRPTGSTYFSPDGTFSIVCEVIGSYIYFEMQGQTTGWISIGLSYNSLMTGSDTYTGWINPDGTIVLRDEWSPNLLQPFQDTERNGTDNAILTDALEADGSTRIAFKRLLNTGDIYDLKADSTVGYITWAVGAEDGNVYGYSEHYLTGNTPVDLLASNPFTTSILLLFRPGYILLIIIGFTMFLWSSVRSLRYFQKSITKRNVYHRCSVKSTDTEAKSKISSSTAEDESISESKQLQIDMITTYINVGDNLDQDNEISINSHYTLPPPPECPPPQGVVFMNGKYVGSMFVSTRSEVEDEDEDDDDENASSSVVGSHESITSVRSSRFSQRNLTRKSSSKKEMRATSRKDLSRRSSSKKEMKSTSKKDLSQKSSSSSKKEKSSSKIDLTSSKKEKSTSKIDLTNTKKEKSSSKIDLTSTKKDKEKDVVSHKSSSRRDLARKSSSRREVIRKSSLYPDLQRKPSLDDTANDSAQSQEDPEATELPEVHNDNQTVIPIPPPVPWTGSLSSKTNKTILHTLEGMVTWRIPNTHVSVGDIITTVFYVLLNIACVFILQDLRLALTIDGAVMNIGSLIGANCVLTVMVATKNSLLVVLLGLPFDRVITYHRWLGRFCCILTALHFTLITAKYSMTEIESINIIRQWVTYTSPTSNLYGLIAACCLLFILLSSLEWIRRSKYEIFIILHYVFFTVFFVFGALHTPSWWWFAVIALILYGMDLVLRVFWGNLPQKSSLAVVKAGGMTQIRIRKRLPFLNKGRVGQYVFVNVPSISLHEWHPFSVSSAPFEKEIEIHVRPAGDWTSRLKTLVESNKQIWVRVDGPYGHLNLNYRRYEHILLVAGGVGITPVIGFLKTIYFNPKRVQSRIRNVTTIWAIRAEAEASLFSEEFESMHRIAKINGEMPLLDLRIHLTTATEEQPVPLGIYPGRPDMTTVFDDMADEMQENACFVFVCGPKPLVNSCWDISRRHALKGKAFHFHHETFLF